jgi:hypothetical protein
LAKPSGTPSRDGGAAVRADDEHALADGEVLELQLVGDRHVVAEEEDVKTTLERLERLERLRRRVGPRCRDQREVGGGVFGHRLSDGRRCRAGG